MELKLLCFLGRFERVNDKVRQKFGICSDAATCLLLLFRTIAKRSKSNQFFINQKWIIKKCWEGTLWRYFSVRENKQFSRFVINEISPWTFYYQQYTKFKRFVRKSYGDDILYEHELIMEFIIHTLFAN